MAWKHFETTPRITTVPTARLFMKKSGSTQTEDEIFKLVM